MSSEDPFDLARFVDAQAPCYAEVVAELAGRKRTHWMWFVFPQLRGLGLSATSRRFGLSGAAEAVAYAAHPLLGARLRECTALVLATEGRSAHEIFGSPDDAKLRSSLTLFAEIAPDVPQFAAALEKYFAGERDPRTLEMLA